MKKMEDLRIFANQLRSLSGNALAMAQAEKPLKDQNGCVNKRVFKRINDAFDKIKKLVKDSGEMWKVVNDLGLNKYIVISNRKAAGFEAKTEPYLDYIRKVEFLLSINKGTKEVIATLEQLP